MNTIRQALPEDYSSVECLWLELNKYHVNIEPEFIKQVKTYLTNSQFLEILEDPKQDILILEKDKKIVGAAWLEERMHQGGQAIEMPVAFIYEICITENNRGKGLGRFLMIEIENWASDRGTKKIEFNVWAQNKQALAFYEELGFKYTRNEMSKSVG